MRRGLQTIIAVAILTTTAAVLAPLFPPTPNATPVGKVTGQQGAAVCGAMVMVKNAGTGVTRQVLTDETGSYRVYPLQAGTYEVTASMAGFQSKVASNVVLEVASNVKVDFALEVGTLSQTVDVSASAAI